MENDQDLYWLQCALELAKKGAAQAEVPVGALVVLEDKIIGEGWNCPIQTCDPTAHAEIVALRQAAQQIKNYRLKDTTIYVTLEPCAMCAGAMLQARIKRLVYSAKDKRAGAIESVFKLFDSQILNHRIAYSSGLLAEPCGAILVDFFKQKRG